MRKVISVLAVLMMLSCWVWVAPQKAEAEAPGTYDVEVTCTVKNPANGRDCKVTIWQTPNNGTGTQDNGTAYDFDEAEDEDNAGTQQTFRKTGLTGWPSKIRFYVGSAAANSVSITVTSITINGRQVVGGIGKTVLFNSISAGGRECVCRRACCAGH